MAAIVSALTGGIGSLIGGILGSGASTKAANQQVAADQNAQNQVQSSENQSLAQLSPYTQAGSQATGNLNQLLAKPGQGLLTPWTNTFTAPTAAQAEQTPGYQFQLQQGTNAMQNSAAAQGGLLSGRTLADLNTYGQGVASQNYQNTFNNALTQYQSAYNTFQNNQSSTYNMLAGQQQTGLNAANSSANTINQAGDNLASLDVGIGKAQAGGTLGSANAWSGAIGGIGGATSTLANLNPFSNSSAPSMAAPNYNVPGIQNFVPFDATQQEQLNYMNG